MDAHKLFHVLVLTGPLLAPAAQACPGVTAAAVPPVAEAARVEAPVQETASEQVELASQTTSDEVEPTEASAPAEVESEPKKALPMSCGW